MATKKTTKKASKAKSKRDVGGRPTKYTAAYAELANKAALLGMTDIEIAGFLGVAESTFHLWKRVHTGFSESIRAGKEQADAEVSAALYRTALGGGRVTEIREEPDSEGNIVTKTTTRELPADVRAQRYWLGNRQPKLWRDKIVLEDETPPETLAARAAVYEEIMTKARERQRQILIERGLLPDGEA